MYYIKVTGIHKTHMFYVKQYLLEVQALVISLPSAWNISAWLTTHGTDR